VGRRNFLVEGVSCSGKSTVCKELQRRGFQAVDGDLELAYQGDPETGERTAGRTHEHHVWRIEKVKALVASNDEPVTFFCGGSRNHPAFIHLFDAVFVLDIGESELIQRLDQRPEDEYGATPAEREHVLRLHRTREDIPNGTLIDAAQPLARVVDDILSRANTA
jgi:thymidylate kinase